MAYELHVYAQFVKQVLEEHHLGGNAHHAVHPAVRRGHKDLVRCGSEVIGGAGRILHIGDHRLAALTESAHSLAEFLKGGYATAGAVGLEIKVGNGRVLCSLPEGGNGIQYAYGPHGSLTVQRSEGILLDALLRKAYEGHIDHKHAARLYIHGGRAPETAQAHKQEERKIEQAVYQVHYQHPDNNGQHSLEKLLHIFVN